ncbi:hypothetical protein DPEC_G00340470 [Dallia pectoralis]|uniref:Uncharacterized protein n=1 Tax=Dallia pectoralis TaxID=75939 RepID=A0ACC2F5B8_DALPE|nr:hypothetical protein DPEC_G00340470 [Dallia pectoralis]
MCPAPRPRDPLKRRVSPQLTSLAVSTSSTSPRSLDLKTFKIISRRLKHPSGTAALEPSESPPKARAPSCGCERCYPDGVGRGRASPGLQEEVNTWERKRQSLGSLSDQHSGDTVLASY